MYIQTMPNCRAIGYLLRYRDTVQACKIFHLNRYELWLLLALESWLQFVGQQVGSKREFFCVLSGNTRLWRQFEGYYQGLLKKGMVGAFEYHNIADSLSIGITTLGMAAIRTHNEYADQLETRYSTDNPRPLSFEESPPARYRKLA